MSSFSELGRERRNFLKQLGVSTAAALLPMPPEPPDRSPEPSGPPVYWPESVLEKVGAEFVGKEERTVNRSGTAFTQETRFWQLPPLKDFTDTVPFLFVSRQADANYSDETRSIQSPLSSEVLLVPRSEIGKPLSGRPSHIFSFGSITIGANLEDTFFQRSFEGRTFQVGRVRVPSIGLGFTKPAVSQEGIFAQTSKYISIGVPLIEQYPMVIRSSNGWEIRNTPALLSRSDNLTHLIEIPEKVITEGPASPNFLIGNFGFVHIIKGLTPDPYTQISMPEKPWSWNSVNPDSPSVFSRNQHLSPSQELVQTAVLQLSTENAEKTSEIIEFLSDRKPEQISPARPDTGYLTNTRAAISRGLTFIFADIAINQHPTISRPLDWKYFPSGSVEVITPSYWVSLNLIDRKINPQIVLGGTEGSIQSAIAILDHNPNPVS